MAAGDEVYMCQQFANPFGKDVNLVQMVGQMSTGSHHFFVFNMSPDTLRSTASPLAECPAKGLEFHPYIYLSQTPNWTVTYPDPSMGYPLPAANGLMLNVHFLNATSAPMMAQATITITAAKTGVVTKLVGNLFLNNGEISVPVTPQSAPTVCSSCTKTEAPITDHDYEIIQSWSHMHQWGLDFQALLGIVDDALLRRDELGQPADQKPCPADPGPLGHEPHLELQVLQQHGLDADLRRLGADERHVHLFRDVLPGDGSDERPELPRHRHPFVNASHSRAIPSRSLRRGSSPYGSTAPRPAEGLARSRPTLGRVLHCVETRGEGPPREAANGGGIQSVYQGGHRDAHSG